MSCAIYNCIDKYVISASCEGPLHIGNSSGNSSEVLIHPFDGKPFIPATGICGVMRSYCRQISDEETVDVLFGSKKNMLVGKENKQDTEASRQDIKAIDFESKVKVTDGKFLGEKDFKIEFRPRVKIDSATGTAESKTVKAGDKGKSGQKFDMEYVAAGSKFTFEINLYGGEIYERELIEKALAALRDGEIQIGGQKSNGCGYLQDITVEYKHYDMKNESDLKGWISETGLKEISLPELNPEEHVNAYEIIIQASTEGEMLVKAIAPEGSEGEDASNIRNARGEYIVPGSSFKGVIRNRMQMIADYMNVKQELMDDGFGVASESDFEGKIGNLRFADILVGNEKGDNTNLRTRIHIDKFTGGVYYQGFFTELNIYGDMEIHIYVSNHSNPEAVTALLLLAIRDLRYKLFSIGSGQNVGKGYLDINEVKIHDIRSGETCFFDKDYNVTNGKKILEDCMNKLKEQIIA